MFRRLGPHILNSTPQGIAWAKSALCLKAVDNPDPLRLARPEAVKVFRVTAHLDGPQDVAPDLLDRLGGYRQYNLFVEVDNERERNWGDESLRLMVADLHEAGVKVAVGSWATGAYEKADWEHARAKKFWGGDALALHCYWADRGFTWWNALRYRNYWQPGDVPVIVTECGRDKVRDGANGTWVGNGGWHNDNISAEQYVAELEAYDAELAKDPQVLGGAVFCSGPFEGSRWTYYETDSLPLDLTPAPLQGGGMPKDYHHEAEIPPENYSRGRTAPPDTIVIHSTRGGAATAEQELSATLNWFRNPASQVSAHLVIAANGDWHYCVPWANTAYHARTYNARSIGIELVQQTPTTPFPDVQVQRLRNAVDWLCANFNIKHVRGVPGVVGHEAIDSAKSDPGPLFPWEKLGLGTTPQPPDDFTVGELREQLRTRTAERDAALAKIAAAKAALG